MKTTILILMVALAGFGCAHRDWNYRYLACRVAGDTAMTAMQVENPSTDLTLTRRFIAGFQQNLQEMPGGTISTTWLRSILMENAPPEAAPFVTAILSQVPADVKSDTRLDEGVRICLINVCTGALVGLDNYYVHD